MHAFLAPSISNLRFIFTSSMNINIKSVDIKAADGLAVCFMVIEIKDIKQLTKLKNAIIKAVNPINIERI